MHMRLAEQNDGIISWKGWTATVDDLIARGWVITHRPKYFHVTNLRDSEASNSYLYLRHPVTRMIARIRWEPNTQACGEVDYMTHEKNIRIKFPKVFLEELSEDDIPMLLEAVLAIQSKRPKKKYSKITEAEILQYKTA